MGRKREHLVPLEKSRRVIYLEKRGREKKKSVGAVIFAIAGIAFFLYCLCIALFTGYGTKFFLVWGAMAVICGIFSLMLSHRGWVEGLPHWFKACVTAGTVICAVLFIIVEAFIFSQFGAKAKPGADYVIILGAQWKQNGPSYVLQKRLDRAAAYLKENPDVKVIVSGGQGSDEVISEAQGMGEYLMQAGIAKERILLEDRSTNTYQNLIFSGELLDRSKDRVVLVTSNFHMFRALHIAEKQGYKQIEGLSARSFPAMLPNNLLREFFGVAKDFLVGNL